MKAVASRLRLLAFGCLILAWAGRSDANEWPAFDFAFARANHALIFLGTVEAARDSFPRASTGEFEKLRLARVRMNSIWKGTPRRETFLVTEMVARSGHPRLVAGNTYVFYSYSDNTATGLRIHWTSRTPRLEDAAEDLAALGRPTIVQRLSGRKLRPSR